MKVAERNEDARYYVNAKLHRAEMLQDTDFPDFYNGTPVHTLLTELIEVQAKGFRGVVLTALVGIYLNPNYDPLNNFYGCNPRSIFEEGIWYALTEKGIPCSKSDPLNVAKNSNQLDENWAKGKRPESAAFAAVSFLRMIMSYTGQQRVHLIDYFFFRLLRYAQQLSHYQVTKVSNATHSSRQVAEGLATFCVTYPEAGSIPQFIVARLLTHLYSKSSITVQGGDESVFGTNTTSKKPADIWTSQNDNILNLYEVTVKAISLKRLDDCIDTLSGLNVLDKPLTFICRIPEDIALASDEVDVYHYKGKTFDFVDIRQFIIVVSALLTQAQIQIFLQELQAFVADVNISVKTKQGWNEIFEYDN
ncbi:hypothetical protein [Thiofilum flexile]|uniref:hypothetical protein n=1 Tax=Thiofilum flexile TaxID=125627 RepID=UPI0003793B07|nr:hypothetical protein [Thiofilum flexile]